MPGGRRKIFSRVLVYRSALNGSVPGTEENPLCGIRCRSWLASAITGSVRALERHQRRALAVCGPSLGLPPGKGSAWGCSAFRSIQRRRVRQKDQHMDVISPRRARRLPRGLPRKRLRPGAASRPGDPAGPWHLSSWSSSKHGRGETVRGTEHHHFQPCPQQPSWATSGWRSLEAPHPSAAEAGGCSRHGAGGGMARGRTCTRGGKAQSTRSNTELDSPPSTALPHRTLWTKEGGSPSKSPC